MYESYYGMTAKPFQLTPDPKFFYGSNKHKQALSYLEYGLEQGEGFIVITGPIGTGKTTIAQNLLHLLNEQTIHAVQIVTSKLSPEDLLCFVAKEYGINLDKPTKADALKLIEAHLHHLYQQGKRALLLVDEAQNLPLESIEELRMLSNFQIGNKPLLQSFLLGQEELKELLMAPQMEQFRQRIIASCHLKPLTISEIAEYIHHRLKLVGCDEPHLFANECFLLIHKITQGTPRKINVVVDRILLYGYLNELNHFAEKDIQCVIDEMDIELSGSLSSPTDITTKKEFENQPSEALNTDFFMSENIFESLREIDDYLQQNIDKKMKINRYLDKLIEQKNIALAQDKEA